MVLCGIRQHTSVMYRRVSQRRVSREKVVVTVIHNELVKDVGSDFRITCENRNATEFTVEDLVIEDRATDSFGGMFCSVGHKISPSKSRRY